MKGKQLKQRTLVSALGLALASLVATPAAALEISQGELTGSWDNTVSYGATWRAEDQDPNKLGKAWYDPTIAAYPNSVQRDALGRWSVNNDDGNVNFPDAGDLVTHTIKWTSELDLQGKNYGAFMHLAARGTDKSRYEYQMLLGVAGPLRRELVAEGYPLRVYVPFGERWHAYSMRRLRENPNIAGHIVGNLFKRR